MGAESHGGGTGAGAGEEVAAPAAAKHGRRSSSGGIPAREAKQIWHRDEQRQTTGDKQRRRKNESEVDVQVSHARNLNPHPIYLQTNIKPGITPTL
jgi:hypothetical protein